MEAERILVVDDEVRVVETIQFFLEREGYIVGTACCGRDALSLFRGSPFDLVLLDISMPGMDGFHVMEQLLEINPELLVIMVTGYATVESAVRALKQGACDYLKKPFEYADLIKTVKNALNKKRLMLENKAMTARLEASELRCRYMVNNSPDLIYTLDPKGCFTFINNEFRRVLGYSRISVLGKHFSHVVHPDDFKKCEPGMVPGVMPAEGGGAFQIRFKKARLKSETDPCNDFIWVELKATFMRLPEGESQIYCIARDVTERNNLHEQLHQAQKMEAIGTLAGGIAHDFNNILMGIQGYTSLVRSTLAPESPEAIKLSYIEDYVNSGSDMTRQLLGFAQKNDHELNFVNINYILKMSAKMFGRTKKDITIHQNLEKKLWSCEVDEGQVQQVLLNLYVNAWQAMPSGGRIYIKTENLIVPELKYKALGLKKSGKYVRVSVVDTGLGMDSKTMERIFDPFFTTKEMGGGTGLGLATAYGIIKGHGGTFRVLSKKGEGSSFAFYLPAKELQSNRCSLDGKKSEVIINGKGCVLLVDDEENVLEVCSEMIESLGYSVRAVGNGRDAIEFVKKNGKNIDLVILDMVMPGMNGFETYQRIKTIQPETKVLLSSGYSKIEDLGEIFDSTLGNFIPKPYSMALLSEKINRVCALG
ncbi:sensory box histidine kinase/response regulator [Desulforapulum autotrophicum HRM2]|uniref:histidine kinase n=1 Tax=Desulforapulum autotrophicum (strain ATCC 43914 / DSM 3382 / VKM B-1955 / HRM2) TaxID=177437 RepID=C0QAZ9_DESAH|nr:response regulator [Desulforapulum autotrophicum]ACN14798.1 sensory box histidine kinase/response regulator [Desulforapulum autotrophicum HRM2]